MLKITSSLYRFILIVNFILISFNGYTQRKLGLEADNWAVELSKAGLTEVNSMGSLSKLLKDTETNQALNFLDSIESSKKAKGYFFRAHFYMVKADFIYAKFAGFDKYKDRGVKELKPIKNQMMKLYADALDAAYHTGDNLTIGWVSFYSAKLMRSFGETGWAVMYSKNGVDLFEKEGYPVEPPVYTDLAELLYQVREYDASILSAKKGIAAWGKLNYEKEYENSYKYKVRALNTISNSLYKLNQLDSANCFNLQALQLAKENKDTLAIGIVLGNIGKILYERRDFDSSYILFKTDYKYNLAVGNFDNAAYALNWSAKANLARGNAQDALLEVNEAYKLLSKWPNVDYLRNTYYTSSQVFRQLKIYDSAFHYYNLYLALNDSLEKIISTSSLDISKARLNNERNRYSILKMNSEKKSQLQFRNFLIAFIILASVIALLYVNRLKVNHQHKVQMAVQQKIAAENLNREQLHMITQNLVEKTSLAEELQQQLNNRTATAEKQQLAVTISNLTILTEADWEKFKSVFEQLHPGFFMQFREKVSDITVAELRMAALTRLQLSAHQMASILGISANSVYKTKQRLRLRLKLDDDASIEDLIAKM